MYDASEATRSRIVSGLRVLFTYFLTTLVGAGVDIVVVFRALELSASRSRDPSPTDAGQSGGREGGFVYPHPWKMREYFVVRTFQDSHLRP